MDAGEFDRRITLQRATVTDDGFSAVQGDWVDLARVWAKCVPLSGKEILAAGETGAFANVRYKIRNDSLWSDLNETDRFLDEDGRPCNITFVRSEGRRFFLIDGFRRGDQAVS
jgi:SPP1 family predicted phage head-tail adaptor